MIVRSLFVSIIFLLACGAAPSSLADEKQEVQICYAEAIEKLASDAEYQKFLKSWPYWMAVRWLYSAATEVKECDDLAIALRERMTSEGEGDDWVGEVNKPYDVAEATVRARNLYRETPDRPYQPIQGSQHD